MRRALTAIAAAWLIAAIAACGSSDSGNSRRASSVAESRKLTAAHRKKDIDNDEDNNDDDRPLFEFGHAAGTADRQAIISLIKRYYSAAVNEDGHTACRLLAPFVAESVVEDYGYTKGLHGHTCSQVLTKLFRREHALLVGKDATLQILHVGVEANRSLIALDFASIHEARQTTARRIEGRWTLIRLLDGIME